VEKYGKYNNIFINLIEYFNKLNILINYTIVLYVLLIAMLFGYILYKYMPCIILLYTDNIDKVNVGIIKPGFEDKSALKMTIFNHLNAPLINDKINGLADFIHD
jgi:hypothetical protein